MLFAETFLGLGSFFFEKQALCICAYRSSQKPELTFRVKSEPNIIKDCNALKFEVFHNNSWPVMGYCGVKKIPKLKKQSMEKKVCYYPWVSEEVMGAPREANAVQCCPYHY